MNWCEVSEGVLVGAISGTVVSFIAYYLQQFLAKEKAHRERICQLIDVLEERSCLWLEALRSSDPAEQKHAMNVYSVKYRLFYISLRRLKSVLDNGQNKVLEQDCVNVVNAHPIGTHFPSEIERLLENLKRLYQTQL